MSDKRGSNDLVERILAEVQLSLVADLKPGDREQLRRRLMPLLSAPGFPTTEPDRRTVTVLFADIRGFTALAESYPANVVVSMLNRYLTAMIDIVVRYGGTIDKLMGDAITVVFGAPAPQIDHVQRALACAVEMQQAMSRYNQQNDALQLPRFYIGVGINSGDVVAGPIGSTLHHEYTVIGAEVNLASRIEAQSLRGQVLIGETTYRLAREHVLVGGSTRVMVKGRRASVVVYELLGTTRPRLLTVPRREIRKSPRVQIEMPCYFQRLSNKTVLPAVHCGQVVDMGYHGMRMLSPVPIESCGEVKMAISLQLLGARTSDVYARAVAISPEANGYRCSMEFTDIDMAGQSTIKQFVDSRISA